MGKGNQTRSTTQESELELSMAWLVARQWLGRDGIGAMFCKICLANVHYRAEQG